MTAKNTLPFAFDATDERACYAKLREAGALLLASASKDTNMKPVMFAAVRRGLLREELARSTSADEEILFSPTLAIRFATFLWDFL